MNQEYQFQKTIGIFYQGLLSYELLSANQQYLTYRQNDHNRPVINLPAPKHQNSATHKAIFNASEEPSFFCHFLPRITQLFKYTLSYTRKNYFTIKLNPTVAQDSAVGGEVFVVGHRAYILLKRGKTLGITT